MAFIKTNLPLEDGKKFIFNASLILNLQAELDEFLESVNYFNNKEFAKESMFLPEIKTNNLIEGINDDLSHIERVLKNKISTTEDAKRIINLYKGYKYILTHKRINRDSLKELYNILSSGLLKEEDLEEMGDYYRTSPVYIYTSTRYGKKPFQGVKASNLDYYMQQYFDFVNSNNDKEISKFIKSQIMHFYFVYIHPFYDVNGRTSRSIAMWYLLNNKAYPYIIFNRAISLERNKYIKSIVLSKQSADMTSFLRYMLIWVRKELEKAYAIYGLKNNQTFKLTEEEIQMIEYFLSLKEEVTIKALATFYNNNNVSQNINILYNEKIKPLLEKEIFLIKENTNSNINKDFKNAYLTLNPKFIDIEPEKLKYLEISKFVK